MRKSIYYLAGMLAGTALMLSCNEDEFLPGEPGIGIESEKLTALYGDSLSFTVNASDDEVPLSTLKVQLYYGEEQVSETVVRTKNSGADYSGKIFVPYYPDIIDGRGTLKFILQNIHFTTTEMEQEVVLSRPDFPYLTLVDESDNEYLMKKTSLYNYSVTGKFPSDLKAYIKSPKVGDNGNELTFGLDNDNRIRQGEGLNPISFEGNDAEAYEVTFNTLTYEVGPLTQITFDGEKMTADGADAYSVQKTLSQGQDIVVTGLDMTGWWLNPDYFALESANTLRFLPVSGSYKVVAHMSGKYFSIVRMNGENEATLSDDGHGALWLMGWGVGSPSQDYQFGWNTGQNYCMPEVSSQVYKFTGKAGPEKGSSFGQRFRYDYISCKLFFQNGYGGEFETVTLANDGTASLVKLTDSYNIELADGVTLEEGKEYVLTVDLTGGISNAIVSFKEASGTEAPAPELVQTFYFDFGPNNVANRGDITSSPDANGNYWNNITSNSGNYASAGTPYGELVNSSNVETEYVLTLDNRFSTNGKSNGGGLLEPQADLLNDFAIPTATEDYFFMEKSEDNSSFTISGLDTGKAYKFYAFGSRNATQVRIADYIITGANTCTMEHQTSGTDLGGSGINQNIRNVCESELIYPDGEGKIKFTLHRNQGDYIALNALKMEEYSNL